jgi:hypothetical protein
MEALKTSNFLWIDASASNHLPGGGLRRREVMQKLALRRKREPKQLHPNSRQLPVFIQSNDGAESSRDQMVGTTGHVSLDMPGRRIGDGAASSLPPSLTTVHLAPVHPTMLVKANLDFVDLCSLASLEVGRYTGHRFLKQPHSIAFYLGGTTWSYCRYVPSLYSQSLLVRTAADCAIARVKCLLKPDDTGWEVLAITSYSNAISVLQKAINDNVSQHPSAEVLCSTQILSLYEVYIPHIKCLSHSEQFLTAPKPSSGERMEKARCWCSFDHQVTRSRKLCFRIREKSLLKPYRTNSKSVLSKPMKMASAIASNNALTCTR